MIKKIDTIGLEVSLKEIRLIQGALEQWLADTVDSLSIMEADENDLEHVKTVEDLIQRINPLCFYGTHDQEGYPIDPGPND